MIVLHMYVYVDKTYILYIFYIFNLAKLVFKKCIIFEYVAGASLFK